MRVLACVAAALAPVALAQSNSLYVEDVWLDTGYTFVFPVGVCSEVFTTDSLTSGGVTSVFYVCNSDEVTKYECPDATCDDVTQCTETILNPAEYNYNCNGDSNFGQIGAYVNACGAEAAATVSVATGVCTYLPVLGGYGEAACTSASGGSITRYTDADCTEEAAPSTINGFTLDTVVTLDNGECKQVAEVPTAIGDFPVMLRLDNCQNMDETPAPVDTPAPVVPQTPAPVVPQTPSPDTVLTPSPVDPTTAEPTFINERCDEDTDYYYEVDLSVSIDSKGIRFPNKRNFTRELCNMTVYQQTVEETLQIDISGLVDFSIVLDVELCILLTNIDCNYDEKTLDFDVKIEVSRELYLYGVFANMLGLGVDDIAGLFLQYCGPRRGAGRLSRRLANIINNIDVHDYEHGCIDPDNTDCVDIRGNSVVLAAPQLVAGLLTGGVVGAV